MRIKLKKLTSFMMMFAMILSIASYSVLNNNIVHAAKDKVTLNESIKEKHGESINSIINGVINYYNKVHYVQNQSQLVNFEYSAMYMAGADFKKKDWFLNEKYESKYDKNYNLLGSKVNQSLILIDLDKDPNNYDGRNLIDEIKENVDKNKSHFGKIDIMAIITLDKYNEKFKDKQVKYNVEKSIKQILAEQHEDGGFKQMPRGNSVPANTGYALMALSKHKDISNVNDCIDKALKYLHNIQKSDGGLYGKTFITGYHSEVLRGLIAVGEDPTSQKWTTPSGKNPIDALFTLWKDNNSFDGNKGESTNNRGWEEATWKALYALVDLKNAGYGEYVVDSVKTNKSEDKEQVKDEKTCKVNVAITLPQDGKYINYFKPQEVTISNKKHEAGFTALGALQATTTLYQIMGNMVTSIYGYENNGLSGWMFTVNGVVPDVFANKVEVKPGDKIIWYYSMGGMEGKKPTWDELTKEKPKDDKEDDKQVSIEPNSIEVCAGEGFKLNIKGCKGNYFIYESEIPEIKNGSMKILDGIKFDIPNKTKQGTYKLKNLAVYNIDESSLENYPEEIKKGRLEKMLNDPKNKVASLDDVVVTVKAKESNDFKIENITKDKVFKLDSQARVTVKATNNTKEVKQAELIVGLFNKNGKLMNFGSVHQSIELNKSVDLKVMLSIPNKGDYVLKAFVWDNLDNMKPISDVIEIPVK